MCQKFHNYRIRKLLKKLLKNQEAVMSALENIQAEIAEVKQNFTEQADALAAIVAKIADLEGRVQGGLTEEEAAQVVAELQEMKATSQSIEDSMRAAGTTA